MDMVADRGCCFIIFIDDLSFESTEIEYKHFKSVLEGGVEVQPKNVLVYVTSNRRNLVKETWTDRNSQDGEIFAQDRNSGTPVAGRPVRTDHHILRAGQRTLFGDRQIPGGKRGAGAQRPPADGRGK